MTDIRDTMLALQSLQGAPTDTLRTNAFASAARKVMAPLVLPFLRRHPQIPIDLVTEGKLVDIVAWGFDLGLRPTDPVPSDMIGPRLVDHVPFGHGNTQTFIAALRHDRLD
ncbi:LysR substrate-binding domain-containing protein, partial [Paracoccus aerius]